MWSIKRPFIKWVVEGIRQHSEGTHRLVDPQTHHKRQGLAIPGDQAGRIMAEPHLLQSRQPARLLASGVLPLEPHHSALGTLAAPDRKPLWDPHPMHPPDQPPTYPNPNTKPSSPKTQYSLACTTSDAPIIPHPPHTDFASFSTTRSSATTLRSDRTTLPNPTGSKSVWNPQIPIISSPVQSTVLMHWLSA
jgi:hypothetical protein